MCTKNVIAIMQDQLKIIWEKSDNIQTVAKHVMVGETFNSIENGMLSILLKYRK